jgi:phage terminase large subunit GpA-like protein
MTTIKKKAAKKRSSKKLRRKQNEPLKKSLKKLLSNIRNHFKPKANLSGSEWANKYFQLSPEDSEEKGQYSTDRFPLQGFILDQCCDDANSEINIMGPAQWGKSTIIKIILSRMIHQDPTPAMMVNPTLEIAESFSKDRFTPMIRDVKVLSKLVSDAKGKTSENTIRRKQFPGGQLTFAGSNSAPSLAGKPIGLVLQDDIDRFAETAGTEGDPDKLSTIRLTTFSNSTCIRNSTPTVKGASRIYAAWKRGNQIDFELPCPHCGEYDVWEYEGLKYDIDKHGNLDKKSVRYICKHCNEPIYEKHKMKALKKFKAVIRRPHAPEGVVSIYVHPLYTPFKTWVSIIDDYLECKGDNEKYQVFWNTVLGRVWQTPGEAPDWEKIYSRREQYEFNRIPEKASIVLAGADVQKDRIELEIRAYGPKMENWGIDKRVLHGETLLDGVWSQLDEIMQEEFPYVKGGKGKIFRLAIDSGFLPSKVYNFSRRWGKRVMIVKGSSSKLATMVRGPSLIEKDSEGNKLKNSVYLYMVGTDLIKTEIYNILREPRPKPDQEIPFGFMHFPDYPEAYFQQITAETIVKTKMRNGRVRFQWANRPGVRNEDLDINVYIRAAAELVGIPRWTPEKHERFYKNWTSQDSGKPRQIEKRVIRSKKSSLFD